MLFSFHVSDCGLDLLCYGLWLLLCTGSFCGLFDCGLWWLFCWLFVMDWLRWFDLCLGVRWAFVLVGVLL